MALDSDPTTSRRELKPIPHSRVSKLRSDICLASGKIKTPALSLPLLPSALLPPLITPDDTRPHRRKIHSHRSPGPVAVATIILEEETLAINYMCAFHLLLCGGEPSEGPGAATARRGNARVTRCQHNRPPFHQLPRPFIGRHLKPSFKFHLHASLTQKPQPPGGRRGAWSQKGPGRLKSLRTGHARSQKYKSG